MDSQDTELQLTGRTLRQRLLKVLSRVVAHLVAGYATMVIGFARSELNLANSSSRKGKQSPKPELRALFLPKA